MNVNVIKEFRGEYRFLSNFHWADFQWRGHTFPTGEHAFVYAKSLFADYHKITEVALELRDKPCGEVKNFGQQMKIHVDEWDKNKVGHMREIVHARFSCNGDLVGKLINTGAAMLIEGNNWNDKFWGRCNGEGLNILGSILMEERGYWLWGQSPPF